MIHILRFGMSSNQVIIEIIRVLLCQTRDNLLITRCYAFRYISGHIKELLME